MEHTMNLISYEKLTKYTKELEDKLTAAGKQYDQMVNVSDGLMEELERYKAYARDMTEERDVYKNRIADTMKDRDRFAIEFAEYMMGNAPRDYEGELHHFKLVIYKK